MRRFQTMTLTGGNNEWSAAYRWGALALFVALATILVALAFEHVGGYAPCPLCLHQRYAYYAGVPLLFIALVLLSAEQRSASVALFALVGLGFLINSGLGVHQAGVEWKWWEGPATCSGALQPLGGSSGGILGRLGDATVIRCDEASWRFSGLSFAGWNAVISIALVLAVIKAAILARSASHRLE